MRFCRRFLALMLALLLLPVRFPASASGGDREVQRRIDEYYEAVQVVGVPHWNARHNEATLKKNADAGLYAADVTKTPCVYGSCHPNSFGGGIQCHGFAKYISYILYGAYPKYAGASSVIGSTGPRDDGWTYFKYPQTCPTMRPGDFVPWYVPSEDSIHAAIVYEVNESGVTLFDCNDYLVGAMHCEIRKSALDMKAFKRYYNSGRAYVCRNTAGLHSASLSFHTGVSGSMQPLYAGSASPEQTFTVPAMTLTRPGCTFLGWSDSTAGERADHRPGDRITLREDKTVYAVWKVNDPSGTYFSDVTAGAWYEEAIRYVTENRLMVGCGEGRFGTDEPLSRAQLVQVLYNKAGKPSVSGANVFAGTQPAASTGYGGAVCIDPDFFGEPDIPEEDKGFTDAEPGAWYADSLSWASSLGLISGYGDGRFGPNDPVTREQFAVILYRYAGSPEVSGSELLSRFPDRGDVSAFAVPALTWAVQNGIISGKGNGRLAPGERTVRSEAASMLRRFILAESALQTP